MSQFDDLLPSLSDRLKGVRGALIANAPLHERTWFRVGGAAQLLFQPADPEDLQLFLGQLPKEIPVMVIGLGSNLLVRDGGIPGVVIRLSMRGFGKVEPLDGHILKVGAALPDKRVADEARKLGLGGFSFYHGIPGGIGGALRMNAGTKDGETADHLISVRAVDRSGELKTFTVSDLGYSYRHSDAADDLIFVDALFQGEPRDLDEIDAEMAAVRQHREDAQPIREKTGGSTFKNPPGHSAWKLVDAAGGRGFIVGDAQVSEIHCNFLINRGKATAYDLELLGETMRSRVLKASGVKLEWEIRRPGLFDDGASVKPFLGD